MILSGRKAADRIRLTALPKPLPPCRRLQVASAASRQLPLRSDIVREPAQRGNQLLRKRNAVALAGL